LRATIALALPEGDRRNQDEVEIRGEGLGGGGPFGRRQMIPGSRGRRDRWLSALTEYSMRMPTLDQRRIGTLERDPLVGPHPPRIRATSERSTAGLDHPDPAVEAEGQLG
jgi:hypothetical protein